MFKTIQNDLIKELKKIKSEGLYKDERIIMSPQGAEIRVNSRTVINFCANNYLGLSSHPKVIQAAHDKKHIDKAVQAFVKVGRILKIIN